MVVEDDPDILYLTVRMIRDRGVECSGFGSPNAAMEFIADDASPAPDVVLCDYTMPEVDGDTVLSAAARRWPDVELVMLTAFPLPIPWSDEAIDSGAADRARVLTKPAPTELIMRTIGVEG